MSSPGRAIARLAPTLALVSACAASRGEDAAQSTAADTSPAQMTFTADFRDSATTLTAGAPVLVSYDPARLPQCRGSVGDGGDVPGWTIQGFYSINGIDLRAPLPIAGASLANAHLPAGALPSFVPPFAGTLQMWFEGSDVFGCTSWDSDYGANFSFSVEAPPSAPGWVGGASSLLDRASCGGPCWGDAHPADGGATYDTWARERAAYTELFFDVWKSGVTDWDNPDLWKELDVEAHYRFDPSQPFTMRYVDFAAREGNNARYAFDLRPLDPLPTPNGGPLTNTSECPALPATVTADGQYVAVASDIYFTVNGVAVQPSGGGAFRVVFENYAGLYAVCGYPKG